ncbi:MAG TPA: SidA/IucD/PvdA family monooxygenase [Acidobacteriota bacterium]|nr:SidA/IucD/PvdA family monooxygenase [Acidobacteriota bacterium]
MNDPKLRVLSEADPRASNGIASPAGEAGPLLDFVGVGFGPSNLALAVAAREAEAGRKGLFFERNSKFQWHPGMMIEGATMRIPFLKDLATLRNPSSPYTFLQYAKARGRLERFVNLTDFYPTRLEYNDYLGWVAEAFAEQVQYGTEVTRVSLLTRKGETVPWCFCVEVTKTATGDTAQHLAQNIVYAPGGRPRIPSGTACCSDRVVHSSRFLPHFPRQFEDHRRSYDFAVVGGGQSAGEILEYLHQRYPRASIHMLISGSAPRPTDDSPFVNEHFSSRHADAFRNYSPEKRAAILRELRTTNYGVIELSLLENLYRSSYLDEVKGRQRLYIHPFSRVQAIQAGEEKVRLTVDAKYGASPSSMSFDGVVLSTGYDRSLDPEIFAEVLPLCKKDSQGRLLLSRRHRLQTDPEMGCGLYAQGLGESSFGIGETLMSLLPFRAREIFADICRRTPAAEERSAKALSGAYPPERHLEHSSDKLYAVMERFRFATLISARREDEPVITQVPLILDRGRGAKGVLFGHMDRANPHVELLEGRCVTALFHGPNSYISPHVYATDQLPTWNSLTVHVEGLARLITDREELVKGLCAIAEHSDQEIGAFRLSPDDPRIETLIGYIVGFEIEIDEILGRFKLSQDRDEADRRRAALAMARRTELGERDIIERVLGQSLREDEERSDGEVFQNHQGERIYDRQQQ